MSEKAERKGMQVKETINELMVLDYGDDAMASFQGDIADPSTRVRPFIYIAQSTSPAVEVANKDAYIEGIQIGDLYNSALRTIYGKNMRVIPCYFSHTYVHFGNKDTDPGYKGTYLTTDEFVVNAHRNEKGWIEMADGSELTEAYAYFVLVETENGWQEAVFSLRSSQIKKAKEWNTKMLALRNPSKQVVPMYGAIWNISTIKESKEVAGKPAYWFGIKIGSADIIGDINIYKNSQTYARLAQAGKVEIDNSKDEDIKAETKGKVYDDVPEM